jgi:hypothetical protein
MTLFHRCFNACIDQVLALEALKKMAWDSAESQEAFKLSHQQEGATEMASILLMEILKQESECPTPAATPATPPPPG